MQKKTAEQVLKEYEEKSESILQKMMQLVLRAQRRVDDKAYRDILKKIERTEEDK